MLPLIAKCAIFENHIRFIMKHRPQFFLKLLPLYTYQIDSPSVSAYSSHFSSCTCEEKSKGDSYIFFHW